MRRVRRAPRSAWRQRLTEGGSARKKSHLELLGLGQSLSDGVNLSKLGEPRLELLLERRAVGRESLLPSFPRDAQP